MEVGQESEHPREETIGTDSWAFLPEELAVQQSPPVRNPTYIQESFQSVFCYLVFKYGTKMQSWSWPVQDCMTFEKKELSHRKKNMRQCKTLKKKSKKAKNKTKIDSRREIRKLEFPLR